MAGVRLFGGGQALATALIASSRPELPALLHAGFALSICLTSTGYRSRCRACGFLALVVSFKCHEVSSFAPLRHEKL